MIIVPICAHSLTLKPLVIPADSKVSLKIDPKGGDAHLVADGRLGRKILGSDVLECHARGETFEAGVFADHELLRNPADQTWVGRQINALPAPGGKLCHH